LKNLSAIFLILICPVILASEVSYDTTTKEFLELCNDEADIENAVCEAFIAGARAGATAQRLFISNQFRSMKMEDHAKKVAWLIYNEPFCIGEETDHDEIVKTVREFGLVVRKENPELLSAQAGAAIILGLHRAFPCKEFNQ